MAKIPPLASSTMTIMRNIIRRVIDSLIYAESFFTASEGKNPGDKMRVLILRKDGIGDCILFYPTLGAYREYYAKAEVTLILPKWFKPLHSLIDVLHFDRIIWFDHVAFSKSFSYRRSFLLDLKKRGYDTAIYPVFTREPIGDFMMRMTRAHEIRIRIPDEITSEFERNIYFVEQIVGKKIAVNFPTIDLSLLPESKSAADNLLKAYGLAKNKFAVIFPGAGATYRIWPTENFAYIIDHVAGQGLTPVICGSPKEKELAGRILKHCKKPLEAIDLSGQTDIPTLAHILGAAAFYFGSDTGILHLAVAIGTPAIAIVGSGGYRRFFPYGDARKNRPLYDPEFMKNNPQAVGDWRDGFEAASDAIHPSIKNIPVGAAQEEVDYMIHFVKSNETTA